MRFSIRGLSASFIAGSTLRPKLQLQAGEIDQRHPVAEIDQHVEVGILALLPAHVRAEDPHLFDRIALLQLRRLEGTKLGEDRCQVLQSFTSTTAVLSSLRSCESYRCWRAARSIPVTCSSGAEGAPPLLCRTCRVLVLARVLQHLAGFLHLLLAGPH